MRPLAPETVLDAVRRLLHHHALGFEAWVNLQNILQLDLDDCHLARLDIANYDASERMSDEEVQEILDHMLFAAADHSQLCACEDDDDVA